MTLQGTEPLTFQLTVCCLNLPRPTVSPKNLYQQEYWLDVGWNGNLYTQRKL